MHGRNTESHHINSCYMGCTPGLYDVVQPCSQARAWAGLGTRIDVVQISLVPRCIFECLGTRLWYGFEALYHYSGSEFPMATYKDDNHLLTEQQQQY